MKKSVLIIVLVFGFIFSCTSETEEIIDGGNNGNTNVSANRQATGSSANNLLSADVFKKLIVEIAYIKNYKPTQTALDNFKNFIINRTHKPEGVEFIFKEIQPTGKTEYTLEEVVAIEKQNRTQYNSNTTIAVWVLFVNGNSSSNTNSNAILGSAYWNTSFVIYQETIEEYSNSPFEPERHVLESSVIHHEFAHILGLTNLGTSLQSNHEDANHAKHCVVENCLMYWSAESSQGIGSLFSGGQAPTLDAQCLADLRANGGK